MENFDWSDFLRKFLSGMFLMGVFLWKISIKAKIIIGYMIAIVYIFILFVPWCSIGSDHYYEFQGYSALWNPFLDGYRLDWGRIIAEFITVTVIAGTTLYLTKKEKK